MKSTTTKQSTLSHLVPAFLFTIVSVIALGLIYPAVIWLIGIVAFPYQANGSLIQDGGKVIGSVLVGQTFKKPQYFHGRPSAAGKDVERSDEHRRYEPRPDVEETDRLGRRGRDGPQKREPGCDRPDSTGAGDLECLGDRPRYLA